ncbi:hypothetical protein OG735_18095 [Streptomyces sp. NBC_01210]|uniref:hypothetical protein n=1 Tax=Streptomyces sp. NBC_01210 TaxID=2903774 RepID=UPI002E13293B|nr:hypothetical protein OG735_18095 [Streptomyces sp. NBC_01210]
MEQKRWWLVGTVVLLPVVFVVAQYFYTPSAEVRSQRAVEKDQDREFTQKPALLAKVERVWDPSLDGWTWVFRKTLRRDDLATAESVFFGRTVVAAGDSEAARKAVRDIGGYRTNMHCRTPTKNISNCVPIGRYKVTLTGNRRQKVQITGIEASVISEKKPPLGTLLVGPTEGGGPVDALFIDLDSGDKEAVGIDQSNNPTDRAFVDIESRWAEEGEPLVFEVMAGTKRQIDYRWRLLVEVSYNGKVETIRIPASEREALQTVGWNKGWPYHSGYRVDQATHRFVQIDQE